MRHHILGVTGTAGIIALFSGLATAGAQEGGSSYLSEGVAAPTHALELKAGAGYSQGFGNLAPGRTIQAASGAGLGVTADLDYRLSRFWSVGLEGQYQELAHEQNESARALAGNLGATYHFAPVRRGDPWIRFGTGYRFFWENSAVGASGVTTLRHGFELGSAKFGYDVRVSEDVALSPVVGADVNMFLWEDHSGSGNAALGSAQMATFVFAGLEGRFDIGGRRVGGPTSVAQNTSVTVPVETPTEVAPPPPATAPDTVPLTPSINVSADILEQCALKLGVIDDAPKFDFDDSHLLPSDMDILNQIADCFTNGPMKDRKLSLVGRTDPRGTAKYNLELGQQRADAVGSYLENHGVQETQVRATSRGKDEAIGYDEATWAVDRRVDILPSPAR